MNYIDFTVEKEWLVRNLMPYISKSSNSSMKKERQYELLTWKAFQLLTGKHLDLKKRIGQKIRVFRDGGNVYVSDHEWILHETYKKDKIRAQVTHINDDKKALMVNTQSRFHISIGIESLEWTIE